LKREPGPTVTADLSLAGLRADASRRAPDPPSLDTVVEDAGRQRLAAYYLYSALLAGVIGDGGLAPKAWPPELAEPMRALRLAQLAPRTGRGLDAQLSPAEQATLHNPGRRLEFAQLLTDLINGGAFGPLCGDADRVRLSDPGGGRGLVLELVKGGHVVGTCPVKDHWELVAQHLAGIPLAEAGRTPGSASKVARQLKETGISHAVSVGTVLAVHIYPLGAMAAIGTRLVRARIQAGKDQADAFHHLGQDLHTLRARADGELEDLRRPDQYRGQM
jgi:hypothetical protein